MSKVKCRCEIRESENLAPGVFSMKIAPLGNEAVGNPLLKEAKAGQFVSLYCNNGDRLLPRPISICEIDGGEGTLRLVYRIVGQGTEEFSKLCKGDTLEVLGPLGNGFPIQGQNPVLIGGGIGIPPLLELARQYREENPVGTVSIVLGYRDENVFLKDEFVKHGTVYVATDDGSVGTKGTVIDAVREQGLQGDVLFACGPTPMLRGVKALGREWNVPAYLSMEERMACGIGACLGCVCQSAEMDDHSKVKNKRVCKDGPVFLSTDVEL